LQLAARFQGTPTFQRVLERVVRDAGSDRFASDIVYSAVSQRDLADEVTNWDGFDSERVKKVFGDRMKSQQLEIQQLRDRLEQFESVQPR